MYVKAVDYESFISNYGRIRELGLTKEECYRLRGGIVHRGNAAGHHFQTNTHILFSVPETGAVIHAASMVMGEKTAALYDLKMFCQGMERAVRRWYRKYHLDADVQRRTLDLLSWRPQGVLPFLEGGPVIASGPP